MCGERERAGACWDVVSSVGLVVHLRTLGREYDTSMIMEGSVGKKKIESSNL